MSSNKCLGLDALLHDISLKDLLHILTSLAISGDFNPSNFRQFLSTLTVKEASKVIERLQSVGGITRVDVDIPDPYRLGLPAFSHTFRLIEYAVKKQLPTLARQNMACALY